jgi:hypothetical protein
MKSVLCIALGMLLIFSACSKDDNTSDCMKLEGKWALTSWTEDDEQFFGDTIYITSANIDFKKLEGLQGDVDWAISYTLGDDINLFGSYMVNASCDSVTITPKSGAPISYAFNIDGDKLTLDRHEFALHVVQEYKKQ